MDELATPNENDIAKVRSQIEVMRRKAEFEKLKAELSDVTQKAVSTLNEFDGVMQLPDTDKVLKTKRKTTHFFDVVFDRVRGMLAVGPVIGNIIAIGLAFIALYYIYNEVQVTVLADYQAYMGTGMAIFAGLQVVKSSSRSILLPLLALMLGSSIAHSLGDTGVLLGHSSVFYQYMMGVGIVGVGVSVLAID